jgi:transcriptional regulator with XRE-family HTH domain
MTGKQLRAMRTRRGWTQAELADRTGYSAPSISRWENEREVIGPRAETLIRRAFKEEAAS